MAERTESGGFYEMLWDCDHCSAKALLGKSQRHCAECGAPQNPATRYFPTPEQAKAVDGHRYEGADRQCPACNSPMGASAKNCTHCGSPLDGSREVKGVETPTVAKPKRRIWPYVVLGIAAFAFVIWFLFIRTKNAKLTITAHRWERTIVVERFDDVPHEAWRDQVPAGSSLPICYSKERSRKQLEDGETCTTENVDKKDGTFEKVKKCHTKYRSEPVNDDWCKFTVREWAKVDEARATGTGMSPAWPEVERAGLTPDRGGDKVPADPGATPSLGATRPGARLEKLILDMGKDHSCAVSDTVWRKYKDGDRAKVEVRARSGDVVCDSL